MQMSERKGDNRVNRNPTVHNAGRLVWDGVRRGPELPEGYEWCEMTQGWWETWRTSPQAMLMVETDWHEMLLAARLHNFIWGMHMVVDKTSGGFIMTDCDPKDAKACASELRIRLEKMGATIKDRGSLGMTIGAGPADVTAEAERVTKQAAVDYRKNLGG